MKLQECIDKYIENNIPYLKERTTLTYQANKTLKRFSDRVRQVRNLC